MRCLATLLAFIVVQPVVSVQAQWQPNGRPLALTTTVTVPQDVIYDGVDGVIVAWTDLRDGEVYVFAQRLSSAGARLWGDEGVTVCSAINDKYWPHLVSDGTGGAIVSWGDWRDAQSSVDVYAQRIDSAGQPVWIENGIAICNAIEDQGFFQLGVVTDGAGGAIVVWDDKRSACGLCSVADVYAQRIDAGGALVWAQNGLGVCETGLAQDIAVAADGKGGAIIVWSELRDLVQLDIYAQRVSTDGQLCWLANGVSVSSAAGGQSLPAIASDGNGSAIIVWRDERNPLVTSVYAQRVSPTGNREWLSDGVGTGAYLGNGGPVVTSSLDGGVIAAWEDFRLGFVTKVYAGMIDSTGVMAWDPGGVPVGYGLSFQRKPAICSDGFGGAVVSWTEDTNIHAQRFTQFGLRPWPESGLPFCLAIGEQEHSLVACLADGSAVGVWQDLRVGEENIYAARIGRWGQTLAGIQDDRDTPAIEVLGLYPNPFSETVHFEVRVPGRREALVAIFDVRGRQVRHFALPEGHGGIGRFTFDGRDDSGRALPTGLYLCRVDAGDRSVVRKIVLVR